MNQLWMALTFYQLPLGDWYRRSFVGRVLASLVPWRSSSVFLAYEAPIGAAVLMLTLAFAPFVPTNVIGIFLLAGAGFWALLVATTPVGVGINPIQLLVTAYWCLATIATQFSPVRTAALEGWSKLTLYLLFFALASRILRTPAWRNRVITVYLLTSAIVSAYGIRQAFLGARSLATWVDPTSPLSNTTRVYSYLENPNLLAGYLLPAVCFSVAAVLVWRGVMCKILGVILVLLNLSCLVLTYSRGGWIGCCLALGILSILLLHGLTRQSSPFWRTWAIPLTLGLLILTVAGAIVAVEPLRIRVLSMFSGRDDSSNNFRLNVWAAVLEMIHDRPVLGIGPGNDAFNKIYPLYQRPRFTALSAYSILLEICVETGLIGFTCFLWILTTTFTQGWRILQGSQQGQDDRLTNPQNSPTDRSQLYWLMAAIATLGGMLGHGLVDTVWYRPQVSTLWWLTLGVIASFPPGLGVLPNPKSPALDPESSQAPH